MHLCSIACVIIYHNRLFIMIYYHVIIYHNVIPFVSLVLGSLFYRSSLLSICYFRIGLFVLFSFIGGMTIGETCLLKTVAILIIKYFTL